MSMWHSKTHNMLTDNLTSVLQSLLNTNMYTHSHSYVQGHTFTVFPRACTTQRYNMTHTGPVAIRRSDELSGWSGPTEAISHAHQCCCTVLLASSYTKLISDSEHPTAGESHELLTLILSYLHRWCHSAESKDDSASYATELH